MGLPKSPPTAHPHAQPGAQGVLPISAHSPHTLFSRLASCSLLGFMGTARRTKMPLGFSHPY